MPRTPSLLPLQKIFNELDKKNYDFYSSLSLEEKKLFSPFLQLRYAAGVVGSSDLQEYMITATNEYLNQNFWVISKHPDLVWKLLCAANPKVGKLQRRYIGASSKKSKENDKLKVLKEIYPTRKLRDL